jgi:hypothetical protein
LNGPQETRIDFPQRCFIFANITLQGYDRFCGSRCRRLVAGHIGRPTGVAADKATGCAKYSGPKNKLLKIAL